jgi:outer membrane protein assembly factor BamB
MKELRVWPAFVLSLLLAISGRGEDWPGWRGPTGQGISREKNLPIRWGGKDSTNVRWRALLPGQRDKTRQDQNQSSPIVRGGRVFVTASYWPNGVDSKQFPEHHVVCYRVRDGEGVLMDLDQYGG